MLRRRHFLGLASATAIGLTLAGCSPTDQVDVSDATDGAMKPFKAGDAFTATQPIALTMLFSDNPAYAYDSDWLFWSELTSRTAASLDPTIVPASDYPQKRSLVVSSGDAPDLIAKVYPGEESAYVASGAVLAVSEYVDLMPNFQEKVAGWELEDEIATLTQEDGKFYLLPGVHEAVWPDYTVAVRTDVFEQQGIALPTSWEEFREALRALKKAFPDTTPFSDRFEGNSVLSLAATTFGTKAGWGLGTVLTFDEDADEFSFTATSDGFRSLIEYFASLVSEGLMDPESFTQSDDQATQKFVSGSSFVISTNSQTLIDYRTSMDQTIGAGNYSVSKIVVPGGPEGDLISGSRLECGIMLNSKVAERSDFVAVMQFLDWLYYSDAGREYAKWGIEGTTFSRGADGARTLLPDVNYIGLNPAGTKDLRKDFGFSVGNFAYGGSTELTRSMMLPEELDWQEAMSAKTTVPPTPPTPYSVVDREQATLLLTPLKDYVNQNALKFITGQRDVSEFDAFVSELEGKGVQRYLDLANKAYKAYAEK